MPPALVQQLLLAHSPIAALPHRSAPRHEISPLVGRAGLDGLALFAATVVEDRVGVAHDVVLVFGIWCGIGVAG